MKQLLASFALIAVIATPASAQDFSSVQQLSTFDARFSLVSPDCNVSLGLFSPAALACWGAYDAQSLQPGGGEGQTVVTNWINSEFGSSSFLGKTEQGSQTGVFSSFSGGTSGTLNFNTALSGDFIVALKAQTFSLFYLRLPANTLDFGFSMAGASTNNQGGVQGLSNATIWSVPTTTVSVPEPGLMLMLLTGIGALAFGARRREGFSA